MAMNDFVEDGIHILVIAEMTEKGHLPQEEPFLTRVNGEYAVYLLVDRPHIAVDFIPHVERGRKK